MSSRPTILHDDAGVLAVDKPSGMTVIAAREEDDGECLRGRLETELGVRLWVVHRIDRDTSGVVVFARDAEVHRALCQAFERRLVAKRYLAFVVGAPVAGRIDLALHAARKGKMRPAAPGESDAAEAVTELDVLASWQRADRVVTLIEARPLSGRQHQIRVHLRARDPPILAARQ
jgi:23S rRNA-/tRNA-specific pseudouridylate synthase